MIRSPDPADRGYLGLWGWILFGVGAGFGVGILGGFGTGLGVGIGLGGLRSGSVWQIPMLAYNRETLGGPEFIAAE